MSPHTNVIALTLVLIGVFIFVFGILLITKDGIYVMFIDFVCSGVDHILTCSNRDVEAVHKFAMKFFGNAVTNPDQIRKILSKYKYGLKIGISHRNGSKDIIGYFFYFPLNKVAVDKIKKFEFDVTKIEKEDVSTKPRYGQAIYIGAIAANSLSARAQMLGALKQAVEEAKLTKTKTVYARAASMDGLRILKKHGFLPVHPRANEEGCFFFKKYE